MSFPKLKGATVAKMGMNGLGNLANYLRVGSNGLKLVEYGKSGPFNYFAQGNLMSLFGYKKKLRRNRI